MKILIAEDMLDMLEFLEDHYSSMGYEVITAKNGREALHQIADHQDLDAIILDNSMLHITGFEVLKIVNSLKKDAAPIIIFTGDLNAMSKENYRYRPYAIFRKPAEFYKLNECMKNFLKVKY